MGSLLPPDPAAAIWRRWVAGVGVAAALLGYGLFSVATLHSFVPWITRGRGGCVEVNDVQALWAGLAWIGGGIAIFFGCFAPEHNRLGYFWETGVAVGLLAAAVGLFFCSFGALFGLF